MRWRTKTKRSAAARLSPTITATAASRHANLHEYDRAIADYSEAIRLRPQANFFTNRGDAYQYKKEYEHAIADYNAALKLDPKFALAHNNLGAAYRSKGDLERAILHYEQAVRLNPRDDTAIENLQGGQAQPRPASPR